MSTQAGNASARSVSYALNLGLETVWTEAVEAEHVLQEAHDQLRETADKRRAVDEDILDREAQVVSEQRAANADMTATEFERRIKGWLRDDSQLTSLRADRMSLSFQYDAAEHQARQAEATIRIRSARMTELGGYFTYLAAVRAANVQADKESQ